MLVILLCKNYFQSQINYALISHDKKNITILKSNLNVDWIINVLSVVCIFFGVSAGAWGYFHLAMIKSGDAAYVPPLCAHLHVKESAHGVPCKVFF